MTRLFRWRQLIAASDLSPTARLVAFVLSLHMNAEGGSCFPAVETIAVEAGVAARTASRALAELERAGYVERRFDRQQKGRGTVVSYTALLPVADADHLPDTTGGHVEHLPLVSCGPADHLPNTTRPHDTSGVSIEGVMRAYTHAPDDALFDAPPSVDFVDEYFSRFWAAYPKRVSKGPARKAFVKALTRATIDELIAGAETYAAATVATEPRYVKHPASWLNADGWLDEHDAGGEPGWTL